MLPLTLLVVLSLLEAASAAQAPPGDRPAVADLAHLMEGADKQTAVEMLGTALADPDARVRGVAARVVHVVNLREALAAVRGAFEIETDAGAAREEIRTLAALSDEPDWESLGEGASRFGADLRPMVLMLAARRQGTDALPLFHRWENGVPELVCVRIVGMASGEEPGVLEGVAAASLAADQACGWQAAVGLLVKGKRLPSEPLLRRALAHPAAGIREAALLALLQIAVADPTMLTAGLVEAIDNESDGEEAFFRELLMRASGRAPRERESWLAMIGGKGLPQLDAHAVRRPASMVFTHNERQAAEARWRFPPPPSALDPHGTRARPMKRTLGGLPAGLAGAVLANHRCRPRIPLIGAANVSYTATGRPARVELLKLPFPEQCREAATLLLRAGLAPDEVAIDPNQGHTIYIPLFDGQEPRFDEHEAGQWPGLLDETVTPPERTRFVVPDYPEDERLTRTESKVVLEIVVDGRGVPAMLDVVKSGHGAFDRSAVLAVSQWRYKPATLEGRPLPVFLTVIIDYNLK